MAVVVDKTEIDALYSRMFGDKKTKLKFGDRRGKVLNFIRAARPKSISLERWEDINLTARYELYLKEQKKELLRQQEELYKKIMKEAENSCTLST